MKNTQNNDVLESATSYTTIWQDTNWKKVKRYVNKQQLRIFIAESKGNHRKVRDLQRMLMHSSALLRLAIFRVTQFNEEKRTPGIDGFTALSDYQRGKLFVKLSKRHIKMHKPKPVKLIQIDKKNGKTCSLSIPTIADRVYQELIISILEPQWEARFEATSYGFGPAKSDHDALERILYNLCCGKLTYVFKADFQTCLENIEHSFILNQLYGFPYVETVDKFLKAGYMEENIFYPTERGIPQNGLLFSLLANIALAGLDDYLSSYYTKRNHEIVSESFVPHGNYCTVRCANDFMIFARSKEEIDEFYNIFNNYLEEHGLILAENETKISTIYEGFDFLGFSIRMGNDGKCIINSSKESKKEAIAKISDVFQMSEGHNVGEFIIVLNPVIEGIVGYWKPFCSSRSFSERNSYILKRITNF